MKDNKIHGAVRTELFWNPDAEAAARVADLLARLTPEEKVSLLDVQTAPIPRLGIRGYHLSNEALHGVMRQGEATVFPQAIALAAMWDPALMLRVATAISDEARAKENAASPENTYRFGNHLAFFSPVVNMARDPRWGRTQETYGEDPFLTGRMAVAYIRGMQGADSRYLKTAATPKHFAANNEEHNRFECNAVIPDESLHNYYLPAFRACAVEGNAACFMAAYNAINGTPCHGSAWLLTDILRKTWGFDGYVISDAGGIKRMEDRHHTAATPLQAATAALNAGVDVELDVEHLYQRFLLQAVRENQVSQAAVDQAVGRVLGVWLRLGLFDPSERVPYTSIPASAVGSPAHAALARQAARESIVLLKNEPVDGKKILPFRGVRSIAVVGNNAHLTLFGHYSGRPVHPPVSAVGGLLKRCGGSVELHPVRWGFHKEGEFEVMAHEALRPHPAKAATGFHAEYFDNPRLEGTPVGTRLDAEINFDWRWWVDGYVNAAAYSVRWTAAFTPAVSGIYQLRPLFLSGLRVMLDERVVEDLWMDEIPSAGKKTIPLALNAGQTYSLCVEHYAVDLQKRYAKLEWCPPVSEADNTFTREVQAARECDAVVAVVGLSTRYECEGLDRMEMDLPPEQKDLIRKLTAANPRVVVVLENGTSLAIPEIHDLAPAIVEAWYPGEQGGHALADVLFGDYNPSGRLPLTFYRSAEQLPPFDDYDLSHGRTYQYLRETPLYPFGHGLSYTTFVYSDLCVDWQAERGMMVSFSVANTGDRDGDEVAQVYLRRPGSFGVRPIRELKGFQRAHVAKAGQQRITVAIPAADLLYYAGSQWSLEPGDYEIQVGASSADIRLRASVAVR